MNQQGNSRCPYCGAPIFSADKYCRNCGKTLIEQPEVTQPQPKPPWPTPPPAPEQPYEREYSVPQRLYKLIFSPNKAMQDIGLAPEYTGPILLVIIRAILLAVTIALAYSKIQWAGDPNLISQVSGLVSGIIALAVVIGAGLLVAYWLGKALIVKYTCDSGSAWTFTTAASVTGYAYLADLILGIISLAVVYPMIPAITLNVSDVDASRTALRELPIPTAVDPIDFFSPHQHHSCNLEILSRRTGHKVRNPEESFLGPRLHRVPHTRPPGMGYLIPPHRKNLTNTHKISPAPARAGEKWGSER